MSRCLESVLALVLAIVASARGAWIRAQEPRVRAIVGATLHPVTRAVMRRATIVWRDGAIVEVGREVAVPEGAEVIDGTGLHVAPGFVALFTAGVGVRDVRGEFRDSLDPWDRNVEVALAHGVTTVLAVDASPSSGFGRDGPVGDGARSAVLRMIPADPNALEAMLVREGVLHFFRLPSNQLPLAVWELRDRFRRADEHLRRVAEVKEANAKQEKKEKLPSPDREIARYVELLETRRPIATAADDDLTLDLVFELQDRYGLEFVLLEPLHAWQRGAELAARRIPVVVRTRGNDLDFSSRPILGEGDMIESRRAHAYAERGVRVGVMPYRRTPNYSGLAGRGLETLHMDAAFAVRGGMSDDAALSAITLDAARIAGVGDRVGSLDVGKDADLLLLSAPPLDYRTHVIGAWIRGERRYDRESSRLFRRVPIPEPEL